MLDVFVDVVAAEGIARQQAHGHAERAQCLARQPFVDREDLRTTLGSERLLVVTEPLLRAAREEHVRRALGEREQKRLCAARRCAPCSSACAPTRTALPQHARKRSSRISASSPALRAATINAPSVGSPCTVQRPPRSWSTALLARSAAASARRARAKRALDRATTLPQHLAVRRVPATAEARIVRSRSPLRARSFHSSSAYRSCRTR